MLHEEICTYEVCKLANEKGFPIECDMFYNRNGELCDERNYDSFDNEIQCYAPTQSLLQRWLREKKGYAISVTAYPTLARLNKVCYTWEIKSNSDGISMKSVDSEYTFSTYELALEDALKYALKNLVI